MPRTAVSEIDKAIRKKISLRLKSLANINELTQSDISLKTGIPASTLSGYFAERSTINPGNLQKLADFFGVDKGFIDERYLEIDTLRNTNLKSKNDDSDKILNNYNILNYKGKKKAIEEVEKLTYIEEYTSEIKEEQEAYTTVYVTEKVAAGNGYSYGNNESEPYYTDRSDLKDFDFATLVTGDSMEPEYNDGDIILVKSGYDNVNGDVYVIDYDGQSFVKKLYNDGDRFRLVSINRKYEPIKIDVPPEDGVYFNIVGKVVDSFTPIDKE